ncbi:MAG: nicotinate phosphoribosyltransferase [Xanthomonadales bacterium]|nr:nicotinate phosphoribosyltransferase [Xanthomonadales bacterium]
MSTGPASTARPGDSALFTDLYELTMLKAYYDHGMTGEAVFEFFVRRLPDNRPFLVAAGLEQLLDYLEQLKFTASDLDWLRQNKDFGEDFLDHLARWQFSGHVDAMPEGTLFFADEPIVRVIATLPEAQLVESRLINILQLQTLLASKALRCRLAAPDKLLIDFGMRRAHGAEAGLLAARACYLAGFDGSATVLAEQMYGVPCFGTMAHSFIQTQDDESEAFLRFAESHPDNVVLLIDTYDTVAGARKVVEILPALSARGIHVRGVRLDSGDLGALARQVRQVLDKGGAGQVRIFASGSIDEHRLAALADAPIDGFGVGTRMDVSADAPYLDCAYKLEEYDGVARRKISRGKSTWPGRKQVWRQHDSRGLMCGDVLTTLDDTRATGEPLLRRVMTDGRRAALPSLGESRQYLAAQVDRLPEELRSLEETPCYPVQVSKALRELTESVDATIASQGATWPAD